MGALIKGSRSKRVKEAIEGSKTLRQALDLLAQQQVLAPKSPEPYSSLLAWHSWREDGASLAELNDRIATAKLDLSEAAAAAATYNEESNDADRLETMQQRLEHYTDRRRVVDTRHDKPTQAALLYLEANMQRAIASTRRDAPLSHQALETFARASEIWDGFDTTNQARALVDAAMLEAMASSEALARAFEERHRPLGQEGLLAWLLANEIDAVEALRARPEIEEAMRLRRGLDASQMRAFEWLLGRLGANAELSATARANFARPEIRVIHEIGVLLSPEPEGIALVLEQLDAAR